MIARIIGWLWIILGIISLIKPEFLKRRFQKKGLKKFRRIFFAIAFILGGYLILLSWRMPGLLSKIVMLIGIIIVFKGMFLLRAKTAEKIVDWFSNQPLTYFRLGGLLYVIFGIVILLAL
jgi:uncharacterized protein YjeT (DUF2065 family)